jgi:hypothetical protein
MEGILPKGASSTTKPFKAVMHVLHGTQPSQMV